VLRRSDGTAQQRVVRLDHVLMETTGKFVAESRALWLLGKINLFIRVLRKIVKLQVRMERRRRVLRDDRLEMGDLGGNARES